MNAAKSIFKYLMLAQGILWIVFAISGLFSNTQNPIVLSLMAANGLCFIASSFLFHRHIIFKIGVFAFLFINLILTFTDQMGFFDYFVLVLNCASITVLLIYSFTNKK